MRTPLLPGLLFLSLLIGTQASLAKSASPIGSWRGSGILKPTNGAKESARCRATVIKAAARGRYHATVTCTTVAGRVTQTAYLKRRGASIFTGTFQNEQYQISGTIRSVLRGNRQTVSLRSSVGNGMLKLKRH